MTPADVKQWRKGQRSELLAKREAIGPEDRRIWNEAVTARLIEAFEPLRSATIGFCWPYKGEFDPRFAVRYFRDLGARSALPVVLARDTPLEFREWHPGVLTAPGVFDLPVPQGTPVVQPEALLIPPIGFDEGGYRLGYGGGYFDRTLAAAAPTLKIGVAFELSRMPTIHPQPHDIPMDYVVTERALYRVSARGLERVSAAAASAAVAERIGKS